jgi:hypothetical protein
MNKKEKETVERILKEFTEHQEINISESKTHIYVFSLLKGYKFSKSKEMTTEGLKYKVIAYRYSEIVLFN